MDPRVEFVLWIVVTVLVGLFFLFLFLYSPIKRFLYRLKPVEMFYHRVKGAVEDHDFYLINRFIARVGEGENGDVHIDHLIFGDKFIYVVKDRYFEGAVSISAGDPSWVFYNKNHKRYIRNLLDMNMIRADRIAAISGLPRDYFIPVLLVNDDCYIALHGELGRDAYIVPCSKLSSFLDKQEKRSDVESFSQEELSIAVRDLYELNLNENKRC
ncbi:MAG: hypothetical protein J6328_04025 [Bacilli bacterium]|nr:hypothetical protein [Bacilli bacterium]